MTNMALPTGYIVEVSSLKKVGELVDGGGWLYCDGFTGNYVENYPELYAVIGNSFGKKGRGRIVGKEVFTLPDMRPGYFVIRTTDLNFWISEQSVKTLQPTELPSMCHCTRKNNFHGHPQFQDDEL